MGAGCWLRRHFEDSSSRLPGALLMAGALLEVRLQVYYLEPLGARPPLATSVHLSRVVQVSKYVLTLSLSLSLSLPLSLYIHIYVYRCLPKPWLWCLIHEALCGFDFSWFPGSLAAPRVHS